MSSYLNEINKNRDLFLRYNELKYDRFQLLITNSNLRRVINSIPILLSINNKKLPGFVEDDVPYGIMNFRPEPDAMKFLQTRFNIKNLEIPGAHAFIKMLAVMGSVGTIAYTRESDFDYWVCVDKGEVTDELMLSFWKKVDAIQNWVIKEMEVEVNIFINDIGSIKENIFAENKEEAFGTVIGTVLKDEFFRSSIIIAGKIPFWWVIPRFVKDSEYEELINQLPPEMREQNFIDLGNLYEISKEDFLGAALFLIIKSLGNPFKSIIKLGVLEKYLFGPGSSPLLSQIVKSNILRGNFDNKILDSYILMYEEVYIYYESMLKDKELLKILRQNLYLKIDPQLSKYIGMKDSQSLPYKVLVMFKYIKDWGWSGREIQSLDNFDNWDYNKTMGFWNMVKKFMLLSYQKISAELQKLELDEKISESDFKLLSGKIKSHFSSEKNKIDHYITFKDAPHEPILVIEPVPGSGLDDDEWNLLKRAKTSDDQFTSTVLKTEKGLVKLLAWTAINQIFNPKFSRLKFQSGYSRLNHNVVVEVIGRITNLFSDAQSKLKNDFYLRIPFNLINMIIINFGLENVDTVHSIHHIYQTSWGESYIDEYSNARDLVPILGALLREAVSVKQNFDDFCVIVTPEPFRKHYKEIEQIFREAYNFITGEERKCCTRFVAFLGGIYIAVTGDDTTVTMNTDTDSTNALLRISLNPRSEITYRFFPSDPRLQILETIFDSRKRNSITIVYEEGAENIIVYIINERGNLFTLVEPKQFIEDLIYLYAFCLNAIAKTNSSDRLPQLDERIKVLRLVINRFGEFSFENETRQIEENYILRYKRKKPLFAAISKYRGEETLYQIGTARDTDAEYLTLKRLPDRFEELSKADESICGFVADIFFVDQNEEDVLYGTTLYFLEKYRMELVINKIHK
jgi:adenylate cyclase, class 1